MTVETPDFALWVHPEYGRALRVQRPITRGSVVFPFPSDLPSLSTPTIGSLQVGVDRHIDGPPVCYLNHSCEPNVFADATAWEVVAIRDIQPGEDLQMFYPANEWHVAVPFECACGTASCLGLITGAREMDQQVLDRYRVNEHITILRDRGN
ncbi:SET domain-containing protein-lysine N-methyltransferase [Jatrophihabitans sp.]|uniref:SET domain-containing protein-lysine N-methyltransferase n=1 Tax=Jatrophihabitans sp. TaxID=1932789 RepID=UPI002C169B2B|nr:SET domain-containing protein-lysine N-methyltransferase [Jatrophihabitans sp.]